MKNSIIDKESGKKETFMWRKENGPKSMKGLNVFEEAQFAWGIEPITENMLLCS